MSKKILYFEWYSDATSFLRLTPLDYLYSEHFTIHRSTERDIKFTTISNYDIIIIVRPSSDAAVKLMQLAKDMHKTVIIDFDDDVLHLPGDIHPMFETYEREKGNVIKCLSLADEVWVATPEIKQSFRLYNKNIYVIPNAHNDTIFKVEDNRPFKYNKIAMYRGGHSHLGDIYAKGVTEWILHIINTHKKWQFHFWGQRFEWLELRLKYPNYYRHPGASTIQFYREIHEKNACVGFYPLADNLLNRSKSCIFFLELTYAGAAVFANKNLPEYNKGCILPLESMPKLMKEPEILQNANENSWELICDTLLLSRVNEIRRERLESYA